jgi:Domain of unknown function (DUF4145)
MAAIGANWICPYCGHAQVLANERVDQNWRQLALSIDKIADPLHLGYEAIECANSKCKELSLAVYLGENFLTESGAVRIRAVKDFIWRLLPPSSAKPQPHCVPMAIRNDYYEACAIRDLSPKASATITRRCLQGMIRDFCSISRKRLIDEINDLRKLVQDGRAPVGVQPDSVQAIDYVREIGNIGAHMEADVNVIVDVDPNEAQLLIELVELLFKEWYVARQDRQSGLAKLKTLAAEKKAQKQQQPPTPTTAQPANKV